VNYQDFTELPIGTYVDHLRPDGTVFSTYEKRDDDNWRVVSHAIRDPDEYQWMEIHDASFSESVANDHTRVLGTTSHTEEEEAS
jgi:hypothetical protein